MSGSASGMLCPDDIESSVLSEMKGPLKEHLAMNTTRTRDNDGVYEETQYYFENRLNWEPREELKVMMDRKRSSQGEGTRN